MFRSNFYIEVIYNNSQLLKQLVHMQIPSKQFYVAQREKLAENIVVMNQLHRLTEVFL